MLFVDEVPAEVRQLEDTTQYAQPTKFCDIVMKGGITSGIVYPLAVCELAKTYTFKNIGGTSAGAIAAAVTAAAEYGRHKPGGGFARIAGLPGWLGKDDHLLKLFQPQASTAPLFHMLAAATGPNRGRLARISWTAVRGFPVAALAGAAPGLVLVGSATQVEGFYRLWSLLSAGMLVPLGTSASILFAALRRACDAIPENFYGLCSGYSADAASDVPLSTWLADLIDTVAGNTHRERPLTFGDLWGTDDPDGERAINLEMMTTCISQGKPYRLPFATDRFFFDPSELRQLFPPRIVEWMENHPRPTNDPQKYAPLMPLPRAADLPVVVAARMSLSFPILISAIPLYAIDYSRNVANDQRRPVVCWFSDGGITSNLPVHFFDEPLPRWPTFAINLREFHPDYPERPDERDNTYMPDTNRGGIMEWWNQIDRVPDAEPQRTNNTVLQSWRRVIWPSPARLGRFLGLIIGTMQNWRDNEQMRQPGYRDRIAHIGLSHDQGGLNLKMPARTVLRLSERGRWAGVRLRERFAAAPTETTDALSWDNHRWVRYRSTMAVLEQMLRKLRKGYVEPMDGDRPFRSLITRADQEPPRSYRFRPLARRESAAQSTEKLMELAAAWEEQAYHFDEKAPNPMPHLRIMPDE